jgi:hypothetical protein
VGRSAAAILSENGDENDDNQWAKFVLAVFDAAICQVQSIVISF